jgi:AmmeMemoRadiSam system protein B
MGWPDDGGAVRASVAAGSFYPSSPTRLAADVDDLLATATTTAASAGRPSGGAVRGIVAPHAGYVYSGPIAATAYAAASVPGRRPVRVIILGPSHFNPLFGLAVPSHLSWRTPLGDVAIDADARRILVDAGVALEDRAHRSEHSIEVQLPFVQRCFPGVPVLPVAVGWGDPGRGADLVAQILTGDTLLVVSTDLSHYHDAQTARALDARTAAAVEALDLERLHDEDACGVEALRVGIAWAGRRGGQIRLLDLRNSADTAGDPDRVVGYGAFAITTGA